MAAVSSSTPTSPSEKMESLKKSTKPDKSEEEEVVAVDSGSAQNSENEVGSSLSSTKSEKKKKMIVLKNDDAKEFEVEESIVLSYETIKHLIEDDCVENSIPLPNVTSEVLEKVIVFLKKYGPAMDYLYEPDGKKVKEDIEEEEFDKVVEKLM
ncbi:hypothetical protein MKX01_032208 [Papaver californicum]|nr:hypothetical protein MKX01_032208 [Papaver californicum]